MEELLTKLRERKSLLERWLDADPGYEGTHDYSTRGLEDIGREEAWNDEHRFLTELLSGYPEQADKPITPDLLEEYGFIADEPGHWFLENEDDPLDFSVRVSQSLRRQDRWELFIDGGEEHEDVQVDLTGFTHLLAVLEEHGYSFEDEE